MSRGPAKYRLNQQPNSTSPQMKSSVPLRPGSLSVIDASQCLAVNADRYGGGRSGCRIGTSSDHALSVSGTG